MGDFVQNILKIYYPKTPWTTGWNVDAFYFMGI